MIIITNRQSFFYEDPEYNHGKQFCIKALYTNVDRTKQLRENLDFHAFLYVSIILCIYSKIQIVFSQMDSPTRFEPAKCVGAGFNAGETELGEVKIIVPTSSIATSTIIEESTGSIPCGNGGCKTSRSRGEPRHESPWHKLKTIFLVSVIVALVVWIIVYTLLAQYQIL